MKTRWCKCRNRVTFEICSFTNQKTVLISVWKFIFRSPFRELNEAFWAEAMYLQMPTAVWQGGSDICTLPAKQLEGRAGLTGTKSDPRQKFLCNSMFWSTGKAVNCHKYCVVSSLTSYCPDEDEFIRLFRYMHLSKNFLRKILESGTLENVTGGDRAQFWSTDSMQRIEEFRIKNCRLYC